MDMEIVGGLLQMNAHMETSYRADVLFAVGTIVFILGAIAAAAAFPAGRKGFKAYRAFFALFAVALFGVAVIAYAAKLPREKIIHACVTGPISLEQIGVRYDVLKVDGKELTLRVREG